jgi:hypothetical protein
MKRSPAKATNRLIDSVVSFPGIIEEREIALRGGGNR